MLKDLGVSSKTPLKVDPHLDADLKNTNLAEIPPDTTNKLIGIPKNKAYSCDQPLTLIMIRVRGSNLAQSQCPDHVHRGLVHRPKAH